MKNWLSFFFQITLVGVVGSASIMAGANRLPPQKAQDILEKIDSLGYSQAETFILNTLNGWTATTDADSNDTGIDSLETAGTDNRSSTETVPLESFAAPATRTPDAMPEPHEPQSPLAEPVPQEQPAITPQIPRIEWAVTQTTGTRLYSTAGKFLQRIDPGTFLVIKKRQDTSAGEMLVCDVSHEGRKISNVVLHSEDVQSLPPTFADASPTEQRLVSQRARILARINTIETELTSGLRKDNPAFEEYIKARDAFKSFSDKIKPMRDAYEAATGARREALGEKLHAVRSESFELGNAYRIAKARYSQWNEQNPIDPDSLPDVVKLKGQLAHVDGQIRGLAKP